MPRRKKCTKRCDHMIEKRWNKDKTESPLQNKPNIDVNSTTSEVCLGLNEVDTDRPNIRKRNVRQTQLAGHF